MLDTCTLAVFGLTAQSVLVLAGWPAALLLAAALLITRRDV
jgi:hypothetical protein